MDDSKSMMPLGEHLDVVIEIDEQDVFAEVLERRARVAREPIGDDVSFRFHSLPMCFHTEPPRRQVKILDGFCSTKIKS